LSAQRNDGGKRGGVPDRKLQSRAKAKAGYPFLPASSLGGREGLIEHFVKRDAKRKTTLKCVCTDKKL